MPGDYIISNQRETSTGNNYPEPRNNGFLAWITTPVVGIDNDESLQKSRLLMTTALSLIPVHLLVMWINFHYRHPETPSAQKLFNIVVPPILMLTVYFISRRGHFQAGIRLGAYVASLAIVMIHVNSVNSGIENNTLFFLVVIIIINSIIDSIWQTMLLFVAQMLALLVLILIYEEITLLGLVDPIILLMMVSILVMIYAWIRNQIEGRRSTTLMEQEQNYRVIFNTSDHIVMIHDGHQVVLCNDAAAKLCGYTDADELIGKSFRDFIHPDDFEMVATRARARLDPNALTPPNHYEMRVLRVDGITHWVDSHSTVIQFGGKRMTMANAIDITERKKAEDALHHRLAFDKIVTGISTRFANLPVEDIDRGIEGALDRIGRFLQASHACIYLYHPDEPYVYNSHEWTAADVKPYRVEQPYLPVGSIPWSMGLIREFQNATVSNLNELSNEVERSLLQSFSVKSFIKVPIVYQSTLLGFLSVDSVTEAREWSEAPTPEMLRIVGEIFATTLERKQRDQKLRQYTFLLETLTILGGIISSTLELTPLMEQIANLVVESLHVSSVHVIELDSDQRTMTVIADYFDPSLHPGQIHASEPHKPYTLPAELAHTFFPINMETQLYRIMHMDDDTLSPIERSYMEENDCKSILRVSLSADHRNHGFLEIRDTQRQHEFTDAEIKMTQAIARQTAIAMNRAQLYRALEQSEARNTIILDSQPDMVFQHASDGTFVDFRAGNEARLYTMPENFLGKKPEDVMPPEVSLLARQAIERVQESGEPQVFEYDLIMNGQVRQYECRMVTAGPGIIFSFARDITVRKQAQQHELDLSLERERVKILEEFVSDASHDLRTPISNLKSRIYLLRRAQSEEAQERQVEVMETEIMRLENLIEDLLTMTQLDADSSTDSYSQIDINYLLQELVDASQFAARQKNIDLSFHPQNIPRIPGNMGQINRIFANLLNNAINYTPEGCISIYTRLKDNGVCVEFSDTGIGIAPEDLPYIFDRFFRADKARSTDKGGTGLGLAIAHKIAELHSGSIEVESTVNEGTTFLVWLPTNST